MFSKKCILFVQIGMIDQLPLKQGTRLGPNLEAEPRTFFQQTNENKSSNNTASPLSHLLLTKISQRPLDEPTIVWACVLLGFESATWDEFPYNSPENPESPRCSGISVTNYPLRWLSHEIFSTHSRFHNPTRWIPSHQPKMTSSHHLWLVQKIRQRIHISHLLNSCEIDICTKKCKNMSCCSGSVSKFLGL